MIITSFILFGCGTKEKSDEKFKGIVLKGATLFNGMGNNPVENSIIIINDDIIECVGTESTCNIPPGAEVINVTGKYITPGLVDAHVHFLQTGFFDGRPDGLDLRDKFPYADVVAYQKLNPQRYFDAYLCSGVTAVYDVGGMAWSIELQKSTENDPYAPHVAASGPLITATVRELLNTPNEKLMIELDSEENGRKAVKDITALGSTGVKVWFLSVKNPAEQRRIDSLIMAVGDEVHKQGNTLIVHATTLREAKVALRAGADVLVHSVFDQEVDEEFIALAKERGTIYTPTLIVDNGYLKAYNAVLNHESYPLDDPHHCIDEKTKKLLVDAGQFQNHKSVPKNLKESLQRWSKIIEEESRVAAININKLFKAGVPIAVGTDAGNPGTLHGFSIYEELEAMQAAGVQPKDLIIMATRNGAKAMQRADDFGTIETGKIADIIILEKDPSQDIKNMRSITHVIRAGKISSILKN